MATKQTLPAKLDVGCAFRKPEGYWGIDRVDVPGVDQVVDLTKFPWDLPDNHFDEVRVWHILQFLPETVRTMEEVWRVAKPGARVTIGVPYYMSALAFGDPSHVRYFTEETFKYFTTESWYASHHDAYTPARFRLIRQELTATGKWRKYIPLKGILRYFLWNMVDLLVVELEVVKDRR
ncbi:MAG: methyltransferase domain-containing protein [Patescibacteria group bacterium]|jgi:SAM-dependent methyltransferase